ncbi:MAG TPA: hypothetical protein VFT91_03200 [Dehalococcoidia bacterium]|nr:hypothetical protein [Dehalococcoidia bacterium]
MRLLWPVLAGLIAALLAVGWQRAAADELLTNGGFEVGTADQWLTTSGALAAVQSPFRSGGFAGRLQGGGLTDHEVYQSIPVAGDESYEFSGWVLDKVQAESIFLRIRWFDQGGNLIISEDSSWTIDSIDYQPLTVGPSKAPSAARRARVGLVVHRPASPDFTVYLDDFSFQGPGPVPQTPTPSPTPTPPPPPQATATPAPVRGPTPTPAGPAAPPATAPPAAAEAAVFPYLVNGGFEEAGDDGLPRGWDKVGGELSLTTAVRVEGAHAAVFSSSTESTKWVYQTVAVQGGAHYRFDAQALIQDPAAEAFLRVSWYASSDGSGQAISLADSAEIAGNTPVFQPLSTGAVQAPAQARSARLRLMLRPASAVPLTVYFDAVAFGQVAPPAASPATAQRSTGSEAQPVDGPDRAALGSVADPRALANVRAPRPSAPETAAASGGDLTWPLALALAVPLAALAAGAALEWRRRRLAAGDGRRL